MTEEEVQNRLGELERRLAEVEKLLPALIRLAQSQQQRLEVISGVLLQSSDTPMSWPRPPLPKSGGRSSP